MCRKGVAFEIGLGEKKVLILKKVLIIDFIENYRQDAHTKAGFIVYYRPGIKR